MSRRASRTSTVSLLSNLSTNEPRLAESLDNLLAQNSESGEKARRISQTLPAELSVSERLFYCLDVDSDGRLKESELRVFADVTGFSEEEVEWPVAYQGLCEDLGVEGEDGLGMDVPIRMILDY